MSYTPLAEIATANGWPIPSPPSAFPRSTLLDAPFVYFGGKSRAVEHVWPRFGDVRSYVEPFAGSLAMLLGRPAGWKGYELVGDMDGHLCNVWRSIIKDPGAVAAWCDWPTSELDLHARHAWIIDTRDTLTEWLRADPWACDPAAAGWWLWGSSIWIGAGWGERASTGSTPEIFAKSPGGHGKGIKSSKAATLRPWLESLRRRLERVSLVNVGTWGETMRQDRCLGFSSTLGARSWDFACGVFLDPPYQGYEMTYGASAGKGRNGKVRAKPRPDAFQSVAQGVRAWAIEQGQNPRMRICLCGYDAPGACPDGWSEVAWKAQGGYSSQSAKGSQSRENAGRERLWFSPACLEPSQQIGLFEAEAVAA